MNVCVLFVINVLCSKTLSLDDIIDHNVHYIDQLVSWNMYFCIYAHLMKRCFVCNQCIMSEQGLCSYFVLMKGGGHMFCMHEKNGKGGYLFCSTQNAEILQPLLP